MIETISFPSRTCSRLPVIWPFNHSAGQAGYLLEQIEESGLESGFLVGLGNLAAESSQLMIASQERLTCEFFHFKSRVKWATK